MDTAPAIDTAYQNQLTDAAERNADAGEEIFERLTAITFPFSPPTKDQLLALAKAQLKFAELLREVAAPTAETAEVQERVAASFEAYGELLSEISERHDVNELTTTQLDILNEGSAQFKELHAAAEAFTAMGYNLDVAGGE